MTTLSQAMNKRYKSDNFHIPEENPEVLPPRKRLLFEIEQLLEVDDKKLELETVRKKHTDRARIPNRDIYRIYKALLNYMQVQPTVVYTGGSIMDREEVAELMEEHDKSLSDLEPSL